MNIVTTERLGAAGRWADCCRLLQHPFDQVGHDVRISIPGLKPTAFPYQAFGAFVMLKMEIIIGGRYQCDEMGLGKINIFNLHF